MSDFVLRPGSHESMALVLKQAMLVASQTRQTSGFDAKTLDFYIEVPSGHLFRVPEGYGPEAVKKAVQQYRKFVRDMDGEALEVYPRPRELSAEVAERALRLARTHQEHVRIVIHRSHGSDHATRHREVWVTPGMFSEAITNRLRRLRR